MTWLRRPPAAWLALLALAAALPAQILTHGQVVGDPGDTAVTVWARLSGPAYVAVLYGTSPTLTGAALSAVVPATAARDFTVRVPLAGLQPATRYWYGVRISNQPPPAPGTLGPIGTFRTAPAAGALAPVAFAFGGDLRDVADYGIFDAVAARNPDCYVSLGDFPYCDGAVTLSDYWAKHQTARQSTVLQSFTRSCPVVPVWDDHEVVNNWDAATAPALVQTGIQAFKDWMPLPDGTTEIFRRVPFGRALDLFLLDTRSHRGVNGAPDAPGRPLLGAAQLQWLQQQLLASTAVFKVIATSVPLRYGTADGDSWDGYAHEREALLGFIAAHRIENVVVVTADQHYAALHHLREGVHEAQAGPLATTVFAGHAYREPEQRWQANARNFGLVTVDPAAVPPMLTLGWYDSSGTLLRADVLRAVGAPATLQVDNDTPEGGFVLTGGPLLVRDRGRRARRSRLLPGDHRVLFSDLPDGPGSPATVDLAVPPAADVWLAADHDDLPVPQPLLLARDFDQSLDPLADFTIVDQGTTAAPSSWLTSNGTLSQTTNIHTTSEPAAPGTMAVTGDPAWTDYTATVRLRSIDNDSCGLLFRYRDDRNYYRVRLDAERQLQQLTSFRNGAPRIVASRSQPGYAQFRWQELQVVAVGQRLVVRLDGELLFDVVDSDHAQGRVGLYAWGNQFVHFDDLVVRAGDASGRSRPRHFFDDFDDGVFGALTIVDQGTVSGPSQWVESGGVLQQLANIEDGDSTRAGLPKLGTMVVAGPVLQDQEVTVRLCNSDDDACGAVLRYGNGANYYRFSVDRQRAYRRLVKVVQGQWTLLWEDDQGFDQGQWHTLQFSARGDRLRVCWSGTTLCELRDGSLAAGRAGLYCWGSAGVRFDDFAVQVPPAPRAVTTAIRVGTETAIGITAPSSAGRPFLLALSAGRAPGLPLAGLVPGDLRVLELNPDAFFTASLMPTPFLVGFSGLLDADGRAAARVLFPPIALQGLSGVEFYCGGFVFDFATLTVGELLPTVPLVVP